MKSFEPKTVMLIVLMLFLSGQLFATNTLAFKHNQQREIQLKSTLQQSKLFPDSVITDKDFMGASVAIDGNRALIGAAKLSGIGVVYVFDYIGGVWQESAILEPEGIRLADKFGQSVSLKGDVALIGAPSDGENDADSGAVYIFQFDSGAWGQKTKLFPNDGEGGQKFGWSVSLESNFALIGTKYDFSINESGSAYMFEYEAQGDSWSQESKFVPQGGIQGNGFGQSVSIKGNLALIAAVSDDNINGNSSGAVFTYEWNGFNWSFQQKLIASDGSSADFFGISVSLDTNRALIGARTDDNNGFNESGSAYVFDYDGMNWSETTKLVASDESNNAYFGTSVSLKGDLALIGANSAPSSNYSSAGAVYLFELDTGTWSQTDRFNASDDSPIDNFGIAVALDSNNFIVGNSTDDDNGFDAGAAYIFDKTSSWQQKQKLLSSLGPNLDKFGVSVNIDGTRAVIGASMNDDQAQNAGSAYIFDYSNGSWSLTTQLHANDASESDWFGSSVSLSGDKLIVGAPGENTEGTNAGSVYIFDLIGGIWTQTHKINLSSLNAHDRFGTSVAIDGNRIIVGAYGVDFTGINVGAAYIFYFNGANWDFTKELKASDGSNLDSFGETVSLDDNRVIIGAQREDTNTGSAYIFDFDNGNWTETVKLTADVDATTNAYFGRSLSLDGDQVLIGANQENFNTGAVYHYSLNSQNSTWELTQKLTANDASTDDFFGTSVALDNNIILVGANNGDNTNNSDAGATYVFQYINDTWQQTDKIQANDAQIDDKFGQSVSLSAELALIGAPKIDAHGLNSGAAFVFDVDILPTAADDDVTTDEDTLIEIFPITNDTDPDAGANLIISTTDPSNGTIYLNNPKITYVPFANYCNDGITTDDFTYTLNGGSTATVHVTVNCIEEPPVALDDTYTINEDTPTTLAVLSNDYDVDSDHDTISIISVTQPDNGTVENFTTSLVYTPDNNYCNDGTTTDSFDYTINEGWTATVEMTVTCIDDPAVAEDDEDSINEDQSLLINVLLNDTDSDGGASYQVTNFTQPQFGMVVNESGNLSYTPNQDYCNDGVDIDDFEYTITGEDSASVNITVYCVNDQPDFNHLGNITTDLIQTYVIEDWAFDFDFGAENENFFQQILLFNLQIVSDSNNVIDPLSLDINLDGDLMFTTTGNIGTAILEISMQDNGGVTHGGVDTSETKSFTITFDDTVFENGFEPFNLRMQEYIIKISESHFGSEAPYFDTSNNLIAIHQYYFETESRFFTHQSIHSFNLWLIEILKHHFPYEDFDHDGIENQFDERISFN